MRQLTSLFVFGVLLLAVACGAPQGVYRGTRTVTTAGGNNSSTTTYTGVGITVWNSADGNALVVDTGSGSYVATRQGDNLTFTPGQTETRQAGGSSTTTTLTSGTGKLADKTFTFTLTITITTNNNTSTQTDTFNGTKL